MAPASGSQANLGLQHLRHITKQLVDFTPKEILSRRNHDLLPLVCKLSASENIIFVQFERGLALHCLRAECDCGRVCVHTSVFSVITLPYLTERYFCPGQVQILMLGNLDFTYRAINSFRNRWVSYCSKLKFVSFWI